MEIVHYSRRLHVGASIPVLEFCPSERYGSSTPFFFFLCSGGKFVICLVSLHNFLTLFSIFLFHFVETKYP